MKFKPFTDLSWAQSKALGISEEAKVVAVGEGFVVAVDGWEYGADSTGRPAHQALCDRVAYWPDEPAALPAHYKNGDFAPTVRDGRLSRA